ncbi:hypothetical protein E2R68_04195 [Psychromonas sp. RZ22]|uniref:hypothetical protein n=1 Tax=Psychromonas algarum TaxID=2555643 RepID=UPI001068A72A|nr:hypothetical protein [Psychromonas sp. RZ22]TEW55597.1 hypothetical protein E2R68_04195 [Psychromonas sp. RZ22]
MQTDIKIDEFLYHQTVKKVDITAQNTASNFFVSEFHFIPQICMLITSLFICALLLASPIP